MSNINEVGGFSGQSPKFEDEGIHIVDPDQQSLLRSPFMLGGSRETKTVPITDSQTPDYLGSQAVGVYKLGLGFDETAFTNEEGEQ